MTDHPFVHLHCHSHYSLLDGASRIPELVARAKEQGMNALALTDHGNLYGAIEFYRECTDAGINPIIGYEAYVAPNRLTDREARKRGEAGYHLTLLAQNETGFRNLVKMASVAFLEGYYYVPRIDKELLAAHKDGLICLSGCASSEFSEAILKDQLDEATRLAEWFAKTFGEKNFFVEIQNNGLDIQKHCAAGAIDIANRLGLPLVATCDAHYLCQADSDAHDVLLCINTGKLRSDANRMRYGSNQFYVRPPAEMYELFPEHHDAVRRSQEIADSCSIRLDFKKRHFPAFTPPGKKTPEDYLRELCEKGLRERYGALSPLAPASGERGGGEGVRILAKDKTPSPPTPLPRSTGGEGRLLAVRERLEHELGIICRMGFASYFLIVGDFVRFAREKGIPASARGSACGAMVSYLLHLSHVDPLEYDLLFERFLDPNRGEAPDIDIDFCQERREEVIAYVKQKYGEGSVAQIGTFGTMAARAAVKDVGRVLDVPLERVNRLTNLIPKTLGITLDDALAQSPDLKAEYDNDPAIRELIDIARKLEGTNRNAGTHAAGVVIANGPLTDCVPLQRVIRKGDDGAKGDPVVTTQWVMGDLEKVGLLKMDFLGLRTLTLVDNALKLIKQTRGEKIDLDQLPLDDKETYALLQRGDAKGVFQFESDGIRELLKRLRPDTIHDIIACTALYRPGPLQGGMVDAYINRKHGREKPAYPHPIMEEILGQTHAVMVYQEQIMRILNRLGGIELSSAYACIKAISKKKHDIIDQRRAEFLKGAQERGVSEATAKEIFDLITFFGGYGFNKSHSAAYALVSYQTAYLKAHYTPEFMAALLSSEIEDGNKRDIMVQHLDDARRLGVEVRPPDINQGHVDFTVADGKVFFGLCAIKGVGRSCCEEIVRARQEKGPFGDLFDFCERVDLKVVQRAAVEKLIKAGAFDALCGNRRQLFQVLSAALQAAGEVQQDRRRGQGNFFDLLDGDAEPARNAAALPDVPDWPNSEKLKYEKEALDFYFSSHPLAQHQKDIESYATHRTSQLAELGPNQEVVVGGMITQVRFQNVKKARNGNFRYARCKIEDLEGSVECVMWPDEFVRFKDEFVEDRICFVKGAIERTRDEPGLVLTHVLSIEQAKRELTRGVGLRLKLDEHSAGTVDRIAEVLRKSRGGCVVEMFVVDGVGKHTHLRLGPEFRINPATLAVAELETMLGAEGVRFHGPGSGRNGKNDSVR